MKTHRRARHLRSAIAMLAMVASGFACAGPADAQQATACRSADATSQRLIQSLLQYTAPAFPEYDQARVAMGLPRATASQITLVSTKSVCSKAATAYAQALAGGAGPQSGRVYVIQIGTTYTVLDPTFYWRTAGYWSQVTFDSQWRVISRH